VPNETTLCPPTCTNCMLIPNLMLAHPRVSLVRPWVQTPLPDLLTQTGELNPSLPFWFQVFPCCHGAPSRRSPYEAHFAWMPCMKGHVMHHVVNTPTIYLLRFAQNSNVTIYKDGQNEKFTIILLLLCPMLHFFWVWWANQSDSL